MLLWYFGTIVVVNLIYLSLNENEVTQKVFVVTLGSFQLNYLGYYDNKGIKTPNVDRFARDGVLFLKQLYRRLSAVLI